MPRFMKPSLVVCFCLIAVAICGAQAFSTLAKFEFVNGASPHAALIQGTDGYLYGTTLSGGNQHCLTLGSGCGTVFKISPAGILEVIYSFCAQVNCPDGNEPVAALLQAPDGNFYGTTSGGGVYTSNCETNGCGTVFKLTASGQLTTLHKFCAQPGCTDGATPAGALIQASDGNFYGLTTDGGAHGFGSLFKITSTGALSVIYSFCAQESGLRCADGALPYGDLVQANDGNFYGTTSSGGTGTNCMYGAQFGCGTIFMITRGGALLILHNFNGGDGATPMTGLVQALDGNLYGTAAAGGNGWGVVFRTTLVGGFSTLHGFAGSDGEEPATPLVQATDGNFYGTTPAGGAGSSGTIFKMTAAGSLTTLHSFSGSDGSTPLATVLQATDGSFYGTTSSGGNCSYGSCGTVFRWNAGIAAFVITRPASAVPGAQVTILGTNLADASLVTFNGTNASIISKSASEILTSVPTGATTGTVQVTVPGSTLISNATFIVLGPLQFVPVMPCRLVNTRDQGNPIPGGTSRNFNIPQLGNCGIPNGAAAYSLNVTALPMGRLGYLTIWPEGETRPSVSTMNSPDGRNKANAAIVPSGDNAVSVFVTDTSNLILDINGYFVPASSQLAESYQFYPLTPCRIVDTRNGQDGGTLQAGMERDYTIAGHCGVPNTAIAYSFNVTVMPPGPLDFLTVWPQGEQRPTVSTLNDNTGTVVANAAIVPAGSNNTTAFYPDNNNTDLLLDVNGYFAAPGGGGLSLYPVQPCRVLDTRQNGGQFSGQKTVNIAGSACAPPGNAKGYVFNATVIPPGRMPYLTLWPDGQQRPTVSTLNAYDGSITSNMALVQTTNGAIDAYAAALTNLLLDISGYFAP